MTREEAKEAAEVMIAYSQGATIWCRKKGSKDRGLICRDYPLNFNWEECDYKVYREREYRPFETSAECLEEMKKHNQSWWVLYVDDCYKNIISVTDKYGICVDGIGAVSFADACYLFQFADGAPFGIKQED